MIRAKKSLGQNFLVDPGMARRIVGSVGLTPQDVVLEIGPGEGALTKLLLEAAGRVIAVELDPRCADLLEERFGRAETPARPRLDLIRSDILQTDLNSLLSTLQIPPPVKVRVVANLPYYISSPVLEHLLRHRGRIRDLTLMLQREVIDRIASLPGGKEYGALSVFLQYYCQVEKLFNVPPGVFRPVPKVTSAVVRLTVREHPPALVSDELLFFRLVRAAFAQRRKTVANSLKGLIGDGARPAELLTAAGIAPGRRAETLSIADFAALANYLAIQRQGPMV